MQPINPSEGSWQPGTVIPGTVYRVVRLLGRGGMGEVYEVEHINLGVKRALKVLLSTYAGREDLTRRLQIEAKGLAKIKHPNLVEVYDLGQASDGRIFFAMELLDGTTLRQIVNVTGRMGVKSAVSLIVQLLDALAAAHAEGMLHRDVKPENIFVCRTGVVKLLDFGVAKAIDASLDSKEKLTMAGTTVGTPRYMSVEQAEGDEVDGRTDVYSAGLVLWELLVGRPAFPQEDLFELVEAKRRGVPPLIDLGIPGIDRDLSDAVQRACSPKPSTRFPSASAFAMALKHCTSVPMLTSTSLAVAAKEASGEKKVGTSTQVIDDGSSGADPQVQMSRAILEDLTRRIDSAAGVDRAGVTRAAPGPRPRGPAGTELLPAVRDRMSSAPVHPDGTRDHRATDPSSVESRSRSRFRASSLPLVLVFVFVPVVAGVVLVWILMAGRGSDQEKIAENKLQHASSAPAVSAPQPARQSKVAESDNKEHSDQGSVSSPEEQKVKRGRGATDASFEASAGAEQELERSSKGAPAASTKGSSQTKVVTRPKPSAKARAAAKPKSPAKARAAKPKPTPAVKPGSKASSPPVLPASGL